MKFFNSIYSPRQLSHSLCDNTRVLYNTIFILRDKNRLSSFRIPIVLEHLLEIFSMDLCKFNCLLKLNPRKLNSYTVSIFELSLLRVVSSVCVIKLNFGLDWAVINVNDK